VPRHLLVRVPASSANLGPGFDVLAAALALHVEVEVVETGRFGVETELAIATDRRNLVVRGFERLHSPDAFTFHIRSTIPLAGGLGSSAAAYVAGLMAADRLFGLDADILALAAALEGHADNAAAALYGGIVICTPEPDVRAARLAPPAGLEAVVVVPGEAVRTREARAALPAQVPMADAVHNVAHTAQLVLGLATADWDLISRGLADRLHQPHRAHLFPRSMDLVRRAPELGALGATISGAGPSVLVWCHHDQTAGVLERLEREAAGWAQIVPAPFADTGAEIRSLGD
jgi:homoserine kinase